jgi:hypothetical protein
VRKRTAAGASSGKYTASMGELRGKEQIICFHSAFVFFDGRSVFAIASSDHMISYFDFSRSGSQC